MAIGDSAIPAPKQARSELSTRKLLDAASELIAEGGYERMTLAAIGERAGYSHGLVTRRFGSKEGLLWALVEKMVVIWNVEMLAPSMRGENGAEAMHLTVDALRGSIAHAPGRMRALYTLMFEALTPVPVLREHMRDLHRDLRRDISHSIRLAIADRTVHHSVDTDAAAGIFVGALRGAAYQWLLDPTEFDIDEAFKNVHRLIDAILPPLSDDTDGKR